MLITVEATTALFQFVVTSRVEASVVNEVSTPSLCMSHLEQLNMIKQD